MALIKIVTPVTGGINGGGYFARATFNRGKNGKFRGKSAAKFLNFAVEFWDFAVISRNFYFISRSTVNDCLIISQLNINFKQFSITYEILKYIKYLNS